MSEPPTSAATRGWRGRSAPRDLAAIRASRAVGMADTIGQVIGIAAWGPGRQAIAVRARGYRPVSPENPLFSVPL